MAARRAQTLRIFVLAVVTGFASPISQLSLSPYYGGLPATAYHSQLKVAGLCIASLTFAGLNVPSRSRLFKLIPLLAFSTPALQLIVSGFSNDLGPLYGPLITELITYFPLLILTLGAIISTLKTSLLHPGFSTAFSILGMYLCCSFSQVHDNYRSWLAHASLPVPVYQLLLSLAYAALIPSRYSFAAVVPIIHTIFFNPHFAGNIEIANAILGKESFQLLDRQQSLTGYISVLENVKDRYRVMRCDHSLLGGIWTHHAGEAIAHLREPVFAIFVVLEAVRLIKPAPIATPSSLGDDEHGSALVIGLGIGTTPAALIAHGINTTILEIDPVVHDFAVRYFDLPSNHTSVIKDAVRCIEEAREPSQLQEKYDYIVHDVFTGGAEPIALFTQEFLTSLKDLLKDDGVIAIVSTTITRKDHAELTMLELCR